MKFQIIIAATFLIYSNQLIAQNSVGIGTANSNSNAVLELVSPTNDQGLLVPRITSAQKESMSSKLTVSENGLLVFDSDLKRFFYWQDDNWISVGGSSGSNSGINSSLTVSDGYLLITDEGGTLSLPLQDIEANLSDSDPTNELQDLSVSGTTLEISGGQSVDLSPLLPPGGTDDQNLVLTGDIVEIEGGDGTQINLEDYINDADADADPSNELQDLTFSANVIALSNDNGNTTIDLSNYDSDVSDDFSGDFGNLSNIPGDLADGDDVVDADSDASNELQDLTFNANVIALSNDTGNTTIDLSSYDNDVSDDFSGDFGDLSNIPADIADGDDVDDADSDASNELQDLTFNANVIALSNDNGNTTIDLSNYDSDVSNDFSGNFGDLSNIPGGIADGDDVDDDDSDASNELQDLTFNANVIALSNDNGNTTIDLSNYDSDVSDDFSGSFSDLSNIPADIADGDDVDDADASSVNELVTNATLEVGNIFRITDAGGNHDVDLSSLNNTSPWISNGIDISYSIGNVGIGIATPASELDVRGNDGTTGIFMTTQNTNENSELFLGEDASATLGMKLKYNGADNTFRIFGYSSTDIGPHLEIGRSGNVRINTTLVTPSNGSTTITSTFQNLSTPTRRFVKITASLANRGIQTVLGGEDGEEIIIAHVGGSPIILRNRATTNNGFLTLMDGINFTMYPNDTLHLIYDAISSSWLEVGRGNNHGIIIN